MGREHHYVPQFYLRNFSEDHRSIDLFNLSSSRHIPRASIKHQCSKRGFHDFNPKAEEALSELEGRTAHIFRSIIEIGAVPVRESDDFAALMLFILLQRSRTLASGAEGDEHTDWIVKMMAAGNPKFDDLDFNKFMVKSKYPVAIPMSAAVEILPEVLDLGCHLLRQDTDEEFTTSDNPVVVHNQFAQGVSHMGVDGWGCRGIQAFLPISPRDLLFVYDAQVYKIRNQHAGYAKLNKAGVIYLNKLQLLNAHQNVYFCNSGMATDIARRASELAELRKKPRVHFVRTVPVDYKDGHSTELISHYRPLLPLEMALECVKIRKQWRHVPISERAPLWRHPPYRPIKPSPGDHVVEYEVRSDGPKDWSPPPRSNATPT